MTRIMMTYQLAMAAGQDAANRRMRKAGRKKWNVDDWNEMCRTFDRLWPLEDVRAAEKDIEAAEAA